MVKVVLNVHRGKVTAHPRTGTSLSRHLPIGQGQDQTTALTEGCVRTYLKAWDFNLGNANCGNACPIGESNANMAALTEVILKTDSILAK